MEYKTIRARLSAYTKIGLPDLTNYIQEAPKDGEIYGRKDGEWEKIQTPHSDIIVKKGSGLDFTDDNELSVRKWDGTEEEFKNIESVEDDTTYYIDDREPELYVNGGTAFSDGYMDNILEEEINSQYKKSIDGGNVNPDIEIKLESINAKGVNNG